MKVYWDTSAIIWSLGAVESERFAALPGPTR